MKRTKKNYISKLIIVVLLLAGCGLLLYSSLAFWLANRDQSYAIQNYDDTIAKMEAQEIQEEWERVIQYNKNLTPGAVGDPFTQGKKEMGEEYRSLLNLKNDGMMGHIKIPRINVNLPIFHGSSAKVLEVGAGHIESTALPVGGEGTHAVLTGHTGLNTAKLFTDLVELQPGDEFYVYVLDQVLAYKVDQILIVKPTEVDALRTREGKDYMTLVTCTPYGINSHRLLVRGERVAYTPEEIEERIDDTKYVITKETWIIFAAPALVVVLLLFFLIRWIVRRRKR